MTSTDLKGGVPFTPTPLDRSARVYVAGHRGLVGSAIVRELESEGFQDVIGRTSAELDLKDRDATFAFFREKRPEVVVLAAAKVGGILANSTYPVDFLSENIRIQANVMDAALEQGVERFLFLGSSCIYPKFAPQPITEDTLLTGHLEETNDAYAIAKIAGILGVQSVRKQYGLPWISAMPTNLYWPNDNFSPQGSHVLPALIRRYDTAARESTAVVTNWGTGTPRREFLHVDDMADACLYLLEHYDSAGQVNVGTGVDDTVAEIARAVSDEVGYHGDTQWDDTKPDGTPQKRLDVSLIQGLGWRARVELREGIRPTIHWYRDNMRGFAHSGPTGASTGRKVDAPRHLNNASVIRQNQKIKKQGNTHRGRAGLHQSVTAPPCANYRVRPRRRCSDSWSVAAPSSHVYRDDQGIRVRAASIESAGSVAGKHLHTASREELR